jgi:transposase
MQARQVREQRQKQRGHKIYSLHAPEVECIGKGKAHRPYELMAWTTPASLRHAVSSGRESGADAMSQTKTVTVGIDLGKNTFHVVGLDARGAITLHKKSSRNQLTTSLANIGPCVIGMEACAGAHHLGRQLEVLGHQVRLMPAQYVKPYLKGQKNDYRDAEAIAEAVQRPTMRFVPLKSAEQLDLQALHRVRSRLVTQRTAVINQIRGFLLERGLPVRQGATALRLALPEILSTRQDVLSMQVLQLIGDLAADWRHLDARVASTTAEIEALVEKDENCHRLMSTPGIGPITSSAMVAAIGTGHAFTKGRDFAAWLGLVPKQMSTGNRTILGGITKRGNRYLRTLFIQGARAVLLRRQTWPKHGFGAWLESASKRLHSNVLVVALAAKLARIAWSLLANRRSYDRSVTHAA